jgi:hypothetical protein
MGCVFMTITSSALDAKFVVARPISTIAAARTVGEVRGLDTDRRDSDQESQRRRLRHDHEVDLTQHGRVDLERLAAGERRGGPDRDPVVRERARVVEQPPRGVVGNGEPVAGSGDAERAGECQVGDAGDQIVDPAANRRVLGVQVEGQRRGAAGEHERVDGRQRPRTAAGAHGSAAQHRHGSADRAGAGEQGASGNAQRAGGGRLVAVDPQRAARDDRVAQIRVRPVKGLEPRAAQGEATGARNDRVNHQRAGGVVRSQPTTVGGEGNAAIGRNRVRGVIDSGLQDAAVERDRVGHVTGERLAQCAVVGRPVDVEDRVPTDD